MTNLTEKDIVEAEEQLRKAMINSDTAALDSLLAPDLIFTNHLGQLINKETDLTVHKSGMLTIKEILPSEQHIKIYEHYAVVSVLVEIEAQYDDNIMKDKLRFTRVWTRSHSGNLHVTVAHASSID
jgi:hypothetical protein